jgi:hypothetical protein
LVCSSTSFLVAHTPTSSPSAPDCRAPCCTSSVRSAAFLCCSHFILIQIIFVKQIPYDFQPPTLPWGAILCLGTPFGCAHLRCFASIKVYQAFCVVMCTPDSTGVAFPVTIVLPCICAERVAIKWRLNIIFLWRPRASAFCA